MGQWRWDSTGWRRPGRGRGALLKHSWLGHTSEVQMQEVWGGTWAFAFLTSSQEMLMLLVQGPLSENCRKCWKEVSLAHVSQSRKPREPQGMGGNLAGSQTRTQKLERLFPIPAALVSAAHRGELGTGEGAGETSGRGLLILNQRWLRGKKATST